MFILVIFVSKILSILAKILKKFWTSRKWRSNFLKNLLGIRFQSAVFCQNSPQKMLTMTLIIIYRRLGKSLHTEALLSVSYSFLIVIMNERVILHIRNEAYLYFLASAYINSSGPISQCRRDLKFFIKWGSRENYFDFFHLILPPPSSLLPHFSLPPPHVQPELRFHWL